MGQKADALAARFEQASNDLIATVESCFDAQWRSTCQGERWSVGVTAHHVAGGNEAIAGFVQMIANGQALPPLTGEMLDQMNAQHAQEFANCDKAETVAMLRRTSGAAANVVRGLSDEQLDLSQPLTLMGGAPITTQGAIENILIGHVLDHGSSIKTAIGA